MDKKLVKPAAIGSVLALLTIGWLMGPDDGDPKVKPPSGSAGISRGEAWDDCKNAVEAKLQNPSTSDFVLTSVTTSQTSDGYDIAGSLTAENSFGVEQQLAYSCDVTKGGTTAEVVKP